MIQDDICTGDSQSDDDDNEEKKLFQMFSLTLSKTKRTTRITLNSPLTLMYAVSTTNKRQNDESVIDDVLMIFLLNVVNN